MGVQWLLSLIVWLILGGCCLVNCVSRVERGAGKSVTDVCDIPGCNCSDTARTWKIINCTFNSSQRIELVPGSVPLNAMEMSVIGGDELVFNSHTFNSLKGFNLIRVDGTKTFVIHKQSFVNLQASSLLLQVQNCDSFVVENNAFKNMQTPITAEINGCDRLVIQGSAFSRLQDGKFQNVKSLKLSEGAFKFENQGAIGRHGPVTNLSFQTVTISEIPRTAFLSSLAEISIVNSNIKEIHSDAFRASQISAVSLVNTTITRIKSGAFSGQTLVFNFVIRLCKIKCLETKAVMAAITNLTLQHSIITEIQPGAINSTIANIVIDDNKINTVSMEAFVFDSWNRLNMNNNVVRTLQKSFIKPSINPDILEFSFVGNEIYNVTAGTFDFLPEIQKQVAIKFDDNFFNQVCICEIDKWLESLLDNIDVYFILNTSYCTVDEMLSRCFELPKGLINMQNFTELVCGDGDTIKCEPYNGETKILDTTAIMLFDENEDTSSSNWILGLTLAALLILAVSGTVVILLIRGGIWLKKKGYCIRFRNMRLNQNEISNDDEGVMVDLEQVNKHDQHDELTPELLLKLRADLENPDTHNEARELIERLYEQFIVHDSYTNNNRQEEETHLYEELGNLQHPNIHQDARNANANGNVDSPINLIKYMEGKFNNGSSSRHDGKPSLVGEYSEPSDAAVHLYSELKQNQNDEDGEKKSSVKSNASSKMAFRPLPDKPKDANVPGPSRKY